MLFAVVAESEIATVAVGFLSAVDLQLFEVAKQQIAVALVGQLDLGIGPQYSPPLVQNFYSLLPVGYKSSRR